MSQPQLTSTLLTSVNMTMLRDRLIEAMGSNVSQADLARECGISRAAVAKWIKGTSKEIKAEHVFPIARLCHVNAEWLATGRGSKKRDVAPADAAFRDIPQRRLDLIRMYGRLPADMRRPIRTLIETLAAATSDRYAQWSAEEDRRAQARDKEAATEHRKVVRER